MVDEKTHLWDKTKKIKQKNGFDEEADPQLDTHCSCEKEMEVCSLSVNVSILLSLFISDEVGSFFYLHGLDKKIEK